MTFRPPPLLGTVTDLYELTMAQSYVERGMTADATFSCFVRKLPPNRGFLVAMGIESVLHDLEREWRFGDEDLGYLASIGFRSGFLDWLGELRFEGHVRGVREGTVVYPDEPILEVTAPLPVAQLLETLVLNEVGFPTLVATKAARTVLAADGRACVDFALRRTQGLEAGMKASRAMLAAGMVATSNVAAAKALGERATGTMAHSYVMAFPSELEAFRAYAEDYGSRTVLLVDTYDTVGGIENAIVVAKELEARGERLRAIRLDSGDLLALSRVARRMLDEAGLEDVQVFASGGLDEYRVEELVSAGAPIDAFGVGTAVGVSDDAPALDIVYKMVEYDGRPTLKLSPGKRTWAGRKQVFRDGATDVLALEDEELDGRPLITTLWRGADRLVADELATIRSRIADELEAVPAERRRLVDPPAHRPEPSARLAALQDRIERRLADGTW